MPLPALFGISLVFGLAAWVEVAAHYIWPALRQRPGVKSLRPILFVHAFRFPGLLF
jgi:hypothetical protein